MTLLASLAMYARPELQSANDALWGSISHALRKQGYDAPEALSAGGFGYDFWENPNLLFSQTCGYPFRSRLYKTAHLIGAADYGLPGCPAGYYHSVILAHQGSGLTQLADLENKKLAFNDTHSQSGYHGPLAFLRSKNVAVRADLETGSHWNSAKAVAEGQADCAAVDAITWRFMQQYDAFTSELTEIARTPNVPGLPFITQMPDMVAPLRNALHEALSTNQTAASTLGIKAFVDFDLKTYDEANFAVA